MKGAHADCRARLRCVICSAALVSGAGVYTFREFAALVGHRSEKPVFILSKSRQKSAFFGVLALCADALELLAPFPYLLPLPFRKVAQAEYSQLRADALQLAAVSTPSVAREGRRSDGAPVARFAVGARGALASDAKRARRERASDGERKAAPETLQRFHNAALYSACGLI